MEIDGFPRFYRHVLIKKRFPHHTAVGFAHIGRTMHAAPRYLGVGDIPYNRPARIPYDTEIVFGGE